MFNLYSVLNRISENKGLVFKVKTSYALAKNKERLKSEFNVIFELRRNLILEHGEEHDGVITVPKEKIDELNQKINDLMAIENDVNILKVPIDGLGDNQLSIEDIEDLMPMIE